MAGFDERRQVLNGGFPTLALEGRAPFEAFPDATNSRRLYRLEWEEDLLSVERVHQYLTQGRQFHRIGDNGHFHIGGQMYYIGIQYAKREVELAFDPEQAAFICRPEGIEDPIIISARRLTKADLMGNLAELLKLPSYQLALPLTREDRLQLNLVQCWSDTTFRDNGGTIKQDSTHHQTKKSSCGLHKLLKPAVSSLQCGSSDGFARAGVEFFGQFLGLDTTGGADGHDLDVRDSVTLFVPIIIGLYVPSTKAFCSKKMYKR